jgi:signal transduction histidine kinase
MSLPRRLLVLAASSHLPRRTVRLRLSALYGGLFLLSGAALLAMTYLLVRHATGQHLLVLKGTPPTGNLLPGSGESGGPSGTPKQLLAQGRELQAQALHQHNNELNQLLVNSGIALAIMTVASVLLGWFIAGRVLRPLRTMTASTQLISERNLHQRLALSGPEDELKELGDTIDGLLGRLESAFASQQRFVANASHELRTPLAMIRTSLDVATGKPNQISPNVSVLADKLREGLDQADALLESFLMLARAEHGVVAGGGVVSLDEVISAALETRRDAIAEMGIDVHEDAGGVCVRGSETLLSRMVGNVIDNAVRHNVPSGFIRVRAFARNETARLVVENGGARLDEVEVQQLAQPFRRLGAERTGSTKGVGLGLSIVATIAAAHAGRLELHAPTEGGLQVIIELPRAGHDAVPRIGTLRVGADACRSNLDGSSPGGRGADNATENSSSGMRGTA